MPVSAIAQQAQGTWEQFSMAILALAALWSLCAVVLLFLRPFASLFSVGVLLGAVVLLVAAPTHPVSMGVLITGFITHAYARLSRLCRRRITPSEPAHDRRT